MKNDVTGHSIAAGYLGRLTRRDRLAFRRAQKQKAMNKTLPMPHRE
jgi:hypothetical protein